MSVNRKSEIQLTLETLGHNPMPDEDGRVSIRLSGDEQTIFNLAWDIARTNSHLSQEAPSIIQTAGDLFISWREDYFDEDETDDEGDEEWADDENFDDEDCDPPDGSDEMGDELS